MGDLHAMLNSGNIKLYTELLTPPTGFETERALGLTFSLDLAMLLSASVSLFLKQELLDSIGKERFDVITALSESKHKLRVYSHYGRIHTPENFSTLFTLLEPSVRSIPKESGSFHPKVWLLQYKEKGSEKRCYRLLVMSKNLTDNSNWDITFHADGIANKNYSGNENLINFIKAIPYLKKDNSFIEELTADISKVRFNNPDDIDRFSFYGFPDSSYSFPANMENPVVISPFLSEERLRKFAKNSSNQGYLLSREEELDKIGETVLEEFKCYVLRNDFVEGDTLIDESSDVKNHHHLHAKCYFWEAKNKTHILLGSANCTNAAFSINSEAVVEMISSKIEIETLLKKLIEEDNGEDKKEEELKLFVPYLRSDIDKTDEDEEREKKTADNIRRNIEALNIHGIITKSDDAYTITLFHKTKDSGLALEDGWNVSIAPLSRRDDRKDLSEKSIIFTPYDLEELTAFFEVTIYCSMKTIQNYVVKVEYDSSKDLFSSREKKLLTLLFDNMNKLLNYIAWLLEGESGVSTNLPIIIESSSKGSGAASLAFPIPLYERLLVVAAEEPNRLIRIDTIISQLSDNPNIPEEEWQQLNDFWKLFESFLPAAYYEA